jgi:cytochrome c553
MPIELTDMNTRPDMQRFSLSLAIWLSVLLFSSSAWAIKATGECPLSHAHMGHGEDIGSEHMDMNQKHAMQEATLKYTQAECASCHGLHGMSHAQDVPNLAGQTQVYLCQWLVGCRSEGKACESHEDLSWKWTDQEIGEMSEFYSHMHDFGKK